MCNSKRRSLRKDNPYCIRPPARYLSGRSCRGNPILSSLPVRRHPRRNNRPNNRSSALCGTLRRRLRFRKDCSIFRCKNIRLTHSGIYINWCRILSARFRFGNEADIQQKLCIRRYKNICCFPCMKEDYIRKSRPLFCRGYSRSDIDYMCLPDYSRYRYRYIRDILSAYIRKHR